MLQIPPDALPTPSCDNSAAFSKRGENGRNVEEIGICVYVDANSTLVDREA